MFISFNSFFCLIFRFFYIQTHHLQTVTVLLLLSWFGCFFTFLSCLIALAETVSTWISGESGHPRLVLGGKALKFSPLSIMLAVGLSYMALIMLRYIPFIQSEQGFYHERMLYFVRCFSASVEMTTWFLSFILLMWWLHLLICLCWTVFAS